MKNDSCECQALVFPYYIEDNNTIKYAIFHRKDMNIWQGISGGSEVDEDALDTAKRESFEEAGLGHDLEYFQLDSMTCIPSHIFENARPHWDKNALVFPEFSFGVQVYLKEFKLSHEHINYAWVEYEEAIKMVKYDSNRTALWELDNRIKNNDWRTRWNLKNYLKS